MEEDITRETLIAAAKQAAGEADGPISRADFTRLSGISQYHIYRLFPNGGWSELRELAGLPPHPMDNQPLSDEAILAEYHRVATELGDIPTWSVFASMADISADVVRRRFGGLQGTLQRYLEYLRATDPQSPLLAAIGTKTKHEIPAPPEVHAGPAPGVWPRLSQAEYGPPIDFRGLRHAPINEQGVVFLFGMVSYELGFIVEAVHASFPDCEAKRLVDRQRNRWQRVRIEFEFRSSSFRDHGHNPDDCDLIVCWEHNWPDAPIEVLELRSVIGELDP